VLKELLTFAGLAQELFPGMTVTISRRASKRTFLVESVNGSTNNMGQFSESSVVRIGNESALRLQQIDDVRRLEVADIAGIDQALSKLNRFLSRFDRKYVHTAPKSCAALLHGGAGTGKSFIIDKITNTGWGKVYEIESNVKPAAIKSAFDNAKLNQPSIIIIDDLESVVSKDDSISHDNAKTLGKELDSLVKNQQSYFLPHIVVIAATQDAGRIPISLKKRGRFTTDILLPLPDATARKLILRSLDFPLHSSAREEALDKLGDRTHAYSAQDLVLLQDAANEYFEDRAEANSWDGSEESCHMNQEDIERALLAVRPTAMHDITLQPPKVRWEEIGGQESVKNELREAVETPLLVSLCSIFRLYNSHIFSSRT
jgi:AAA family ATPase